jgi:hypothetical protein
MTDHLYTVTDISDSIPLAGDYSARLDWRRLITYVLEYSLRILMYYSTESALLPPLLPKGRFRMMSFCNMPDICFSSLSSEALNAQTTMWVRSGIRGNHVCSGQKPEGRASNATN